MSDADDNDGDGNDDEVDKVCRSRKADDACPFSSPCTSWVICVMCVARALEEGDNEGL